jgi:hypothetical protein
VRRFHFVAQSCPGHLPLTSWTRWTSKDFANVYQFILGKTIYIWFIDMDLQYECKYISTESYLLDFVSRSRITMYMHVQVICIYWLKADFAKRCNWNLQILLTQPYKCDCISKSDHCQPLDGCYVHQCMYIFFVQIRADLIYLKSLCKPYRHNIRLWNYRSVLGIQYKCTCISKSFFLNFVSG